MRIIATISLLISTLASFAQTADVTKGCAPLTVQFTPPPGATGFFWDFKDGGSSNLQSPQNIFTTPGTYAVDFKNSPGGATVGTVTITVYPKPTVAIAANPMSGCKPLLVAFSDTSKLPGDVMILNRFWVYGDGGSDAGTASPSHVYNAAGSFTVSLELVTNYPSCNVTEVFQDKIKVGNRPVVAFSTTPSPPSSCEPPLVVSFQNSTAGGTPPLTYNWDFANGNTSILGNPPSQTYSQNGAYKVVLTATDAIGCSATAQALVLIGSPDATIGVPDTVCFQQKFQITSQPGGTLYEWNFGPNASPMTSTQANPNVQFNTTGFQTVTLTVTAAGGCTGSSTKQVYVDRADPSFTASPTYSCSEPTIFNFTANSPLATGWEWRFSDGTFAVTKNATYTWHNPDTLGYTSNGAFLDTVYLLVGNPSGCFAETFRIDTIWLPNARFMPNVQHGCAPLAVIFSDSSHSREKIVEWSWDFDDGSPVVVNTTNADVPHTFTQPGEYEVRLAIRNERGCVDTSYVILIEVGEEILGDFTADVTELCPGDSVHFTNLTNDPRVDGWHFSSESHRQWHCFQNANPAWTFNNETGPMSVSLTTEYNGCLATVTKDSFILSKGPIAKIEYKTTCENTRLFDFTDKSMGAEKITWVLGDGDSSNLATFSHLYDVAGTYTVILKAENATTGCPLSCDTVKVYATDLKAEFDALPLRICAGAPYILNGSPSTDVNNVCFKGYTWYFTTQRPIRTDKDSIEFLFNGMGPHKFWLEVEDINGCKDTVGQDVILYNRYPSFTLSDNLICIPGTVNFTSTSTADTTITEVEWDFGDGTTATGNSVSHTFTTPPPNGQYFDVVLRITDVVNCPAEIIQRVFVYKPTSTIISIPQTPNICAGKDVVFSATDFTAGGSSLTWQWDFGNGQSGSGKVVQSTYPQAGTFPVKLTYTEIATGCTDMTTVNVNVQAYPNATFSSNVDGQNILCYPQSISLQNTTVTNPPASVVWNLGNGQSSTGNSAAVTFPKGTYKIQMIAITSFGCIDTTERSFTVVGPEGNFTIDKSKICAGGSITFNLKDTVDISSFSWNFGDGTTLDNVNPTTHNYPFVPPSGQTVVKLILRGEDDACTVAIEQPVNFSQVNASFSATSGCLGAPAVFQNNSTDGDVFTWNFGDGNTSGAANPSHEYTVAGDYTVTLIATDQPEGCRDTFSTVVKIAGLPNFQAVGDTICPGDTATIAVLTPLSNATYAWTPTNLVLQPKNLPTVRVLPTTTSSFVVVATDAQGCEGRDTVQVIVFDTDFQGARDLDTIIVKDSEVTLPVTGDPLFNFTWGDPNYIFTSVDPWKVKPDTSTEYTLTVADKLGCNETDFRFIIRVISEDLGIPNAFTPNGDDKNDFFKLISFGEKGLVEIEYLKIYDRWGELVFSGSGTDETVKWDGKIDGEDAPSDVYVWIASVKFLTGKVLPISGDLTLLR